MLAGKIGIVFGAANKRSLAWGVAEAWVRQGARVHVVCQSDRFVSGLEKLASELRYVSFGGVAGVHVCDVTSDDAIQRVFDSVVSEDPGLSAGLPLDSVLHAVAHAPTAAMHGSLLATTRADFAAAHDVSAYSLLTIARSAHPLLTRQRSNLLSPGPSLSSSKIDGSEDGHSSGGGAGGSITALSFMGATKAVPGYNVMGCAKASLEAAARGLAMELGPTSMGSVRVNILSPGPVSTLASRGVRGFVEMKNAALTKAPLERTATASEVGAAAAFLASDSALSITGQTIYLDGGLSALAP
jgi:enoyl-[acyl-carrier protein] reductase I